MNSLPYECTLNELIFKIFNTFSGYFACNMNFWASTRSKLCSITFQVFWYIIRGLR